MPTVVVAGREIASELDFHRVLAAALDFGSFYGHNLDALWDRLTVDVDRPLQIIWTHASTRRENLGADEFDRILRLLREVEAHDASLGRAERLALGPGATTAATRA